MILTCKSKGGNLLYYYCDWPGDLLLKPYYLFPQNSAQIIGIMSNNKKKTNTQQDSEKTSNPNELFNNLDHWYDCKVELDNGTSAAEHKVLKKIKEIIQDHFK